MASSSSSSAESDSEWSEVGISVYFCLFSALLTVVLILSKLLHDRPILSSLLPEAGMILLVGLAAGLVLQLFYHPQGDAGTANVFYDDAYYVADDDAAAAAAAAMDDAVTQAAVGSLLSFSPRVFFIALLPPIIFNSGFHLRRELFFRHLLPICLFAVIGTTVSAVFCAAFLELCKWCSLTGGFAPTFTELLAFGSLVSATDPVSTLAVFQAKRVDPHLFYLVFGESVLNDAVGLVLFQAFSRMVTAQLGAAGAVVGLGRFVLSFTLDSLGSPILGLVCGCAAALLFKHVDFRKTRVTELSVYVLIMYVPFMLAEIMHLSGIVTILFTGMAAKAYVVPNLSAVTAAQGETLFRLAAHLAETAIFLELGMSACGQAPHHGHAAFTACAVVACLVGRALHVYPIAYYYNRQLQHVTLEQEINLDQDYVPHRDDAVNSGQVNRSHVEMKSSQPQQPSSSQPMEIARAPSHATLTPEVHRDLKMSRATQHMLWFSGLRGAVAYACVRSFPDTHGHAQDFVVTTMAIILLTVFVLGGTTEMALNYWKIPMHVDEDAYMADWHAQRQSDGLALRVHALLRAKVVRAPSETTGTPKEILVQHAAAAGDASQQNQSHVEWCLDALDDDRTWKTKESLFDYGGENH